MPNRNAKQMLTGCVRAAGRRLRRALAMDRQAPAEAMQLAIAIPLPDHVAHEVVKLQLSILRKYGPHEGLEAHPHITLKLGYPATDFLLFENHLKQVSMQFEPTTIEIDGFDSFDEGILFLNVRPNPELELMRQRLLRDLNSMFGIVPLEIEDSGYRFHVTVASGLPRRDFHRIRDEFSSQQISFRFVASHIEQLCHTGAHWVVCRRLPLDACAQDESESQSDSGNATTSSKADRHE